MPEFYEKTIDATQAKQLAENNDWLINHLFKEIRYAAGQNRDSIIWCTEDLNSNALKNAIKTLEQKGFTVQELGDGESIVIKW